MTLLKSDRDALVEAARNVPLAMVGHVGTGQALGHLAHVLARVAEALPVEEENPQPTEDCERAAALGEPCEHSEPDFAAMALDAAATIYGKDCVDPSHEEVEILTRWLRANTHRFAAPAPAVVRDAFDVEAFRREVQRRCDAQTGAFSAGKIAADVAREMWLGKGGA